MISEADTCRKYVLPKLYNAGRLDDRIREQVTFTHGCIVVVGGVVKRRRQKRAHFAAAATVAPVLFGREL